jgi:hypothetical protein
MNNILLTRPPPYKLLHFGFRLLELLPAEIG